MRGLVELLRGLVHPENLFLACSNDHLLRYDHAYQLNDHANIDTKDARACTYSEWCENGSIFTDPRMETKTKPFIGYYCMCSSQVIELWTR